MENNLHYVVFVGKVPGIYNSLEECQAQVAGQHEGLFKTYTTREEAEKAFLTLPEKKSRIDKASAWLIEHHGWSIFFSLCLLLLGTWMAYGHHSKVADNTLLYIVLVAGVVFGHFLIILGEALTVLFLIHNFIERRTHKENLRLLNKQRLATEHGISRLLDKFEEKAELKIKALETSLFRAILSGLIPHKLVDKIWTDKLFETKIIRSDMSVKYSVQSCNARHLCLAHNLTFTIENVSNIPKDSVDYIFEFSWEENSAEYEYSFKHAEYQLPNGDVEILEFKDFEKKQTDPGDPYATYTLPKPIKILPGEFIKVTRVTECTYKQDGTASDYFFVNLHTLNTSVSFELSEEYGHRFKPNFLETSSMKKTEKYKLTEYNGIVYLMPGQGFSFDIYRKVPFAKKNRHVSPVISKS